MSQQPSVGRIVHYTPPGDATQDDSCMAAIVTFIAHDRQPCLAVFFPPLVHQLQPPHPVPERQGDVPEGGTWHWPERT